MNYRDVTASDAIRIALLYAESWELIHNGVLRDEFVENEAVTEQLLVWADRLTMPSNNQVVIVAEQNSHMGGFVCAYGNEDLTWGSLIDNLHVAREQKRRGIGSALMRKAGAWLARRYPESGIYLWVLESNDPARSFYERLGAIDAGVVERQSSAGEVTRNCRYIWPDPAMLLNAEC